MDSLETLVNRIMTEKGIRTFCKPYNLNPKHVINAPDQYVKTLTQGKKPFIHMLDDLREPVISYLTNGHDPQTKRYVMALTIATAYAASPHAPPEWKDQRETFQNHLKSYVQPANHF